MTITIDPTDADPGFTAFENLIICDLVNDNRYLDAVLGYQVGAGASSTPIEASNAPSATLPNKAAAGAVPPADRRTRIQDVLEWHETRPWRLPGSTLSFKGSDAPDVGGPPATYRPDPLASDDVEPASEDIGYFLQALSTPVPAGDPSPDMRQRQREMLAITADRFAGALSISTGRRIVQSLSMFVDFTVRKDKSRNVLMW